MSFLKRLFSPDPREALRPAYHRLMEKAREPHWYREGGVPDTIDGRFDMLVAVLSVLLLHLERAGRNREGVLLTELFVEDMEAQIRQIGIGDVMVGKHVGRLMSALGGRLTAYRDGFAGEANLEEALERNLYRGEAPSADAVAHVAGRLRALDEGLEQAGPDGVVAGKEWP